MWFKCKDYKLLRNSSFTLFSVQKKPKNIYIYFKTSTKFSTKWNKNIKIELAGWKSFPNSKIRPSVWKVTQSIQLRSFFKCRSRSRSRSQIWSRSRSQFLRSGSCFAVLKVTQSIYLLKSVLKVTQSMCAQDRVNLVNCWLEARQIRRFSPSNSQYGGKIPIKHFAFHLPY